MIVRQVNASALLIMMVLHVRELFVQMLVVMLVYVSHKSNYLKKHIHNLSLQAQAKVNIPTHGMPRSTLDAYAILVDVVLTAH